MIFFWKLVHPNINMSNLIGFDIECEAVCVVDSWVMLWGRSAGWRVGCVWTGGGARVAGRRCGRVRRGSHVAGRRGARRQPAAPHCRRVVTPARHVWNHCWVLLKTWKSSSSQQTDRISQAIRDHTGRIYNGGSQHHRTQHTKHERVSSHGV